MQDTCEILNRHQERIDHTFHPGVKSDALVILGHGLTGNKDRPLLIALAEGLAARGWPALRISYSGNGQSGGSFVKSNITKDIADLQSVLDVVPDDVKVAYIGHSMGGAVGVLTAARDLRIRFLVSLAGMTHTAAFVRREFGDVLPGEGFMWDDEKFPLSQEFVDDLTYTNDTLPAAESLIQPWLLIHGSDDDLVPVQDGLDAYEAATLCPKKWIELPGAGHSLEGYHAEIIDAVDSWLAAAFSSTALSEA